MSHVADEKSFWMRPLLQAAGIYNLLFGAFVIIAPNAIFRLFGIPDPIYPSIWQCVGMVVGVYGIGYLIAATNPVRHWPIVMVGFLGKLFGPIGFLFVAWSGELPWTWAGLLLLNDLIWWIPFVSILYYAFDQSSDTSAKNNPITFRGAVRSVRNNRGSTIAELSANEPVMLVFLRHLGCTFCREALADLTRYRDQIEAAGVKLALVHMSPPMQATQTLEQCGLGDLHRFNDPHCALYQAFNVERGNVVQLFGPKVWWRGVMAGFFGGHGVGKLAGDGFRMPGVFVIRDSEIVFENRAQSAADRPDYVEIARNNGMPSLDDTNSPFQHSSSVAV